MQANLFVGAWGKDGKIEGRDQRSGRSRYGTRNRKIEGRDQGRGIWGAWDKERKD
jgi:hypothetical protein